MLLQVHDWLGTGFGLELFAWAAASAGEYRRAATLLGACESVRRLCGASLTDAGAFAANHAACERDTRQTLGKDAWLAQFEEGRRLTVDEAAWYALAEPATAVPSARAAAQPPATADPLSRREEQVARLVADGLTNGEIANRLVISARTAESHVQHILGKLGYTNRAQIARWVAERDGAARQAPRRSSHRT